MGKLIDTDILKGCKIIQPCKDEMTGRAFVRILEVDEIPPAYDPVRIMELLEAGYSVRLCVSVNGSDHLISVSRAEKIGEDCGNERKTRLIDANTIKWDEGEDADGNPVYILDKRDIDKQPTAYDQGKVIDQLEEIKSKCLRRGDLVGCTDFKMAIEIVKGGVVDV